MRPLRRALVVVLATLAACDGGSPGDGPGPGPAPTGTETVVRIPASYPYPDGGQAVQSGDRLFVVSEAALFAVTADGRPVRWRTLGGLTAVHDVAPDGHGGIVVLGSTTTNGYAFTATALRFDAGLDLVWARAYDAGTIGTPDPFWRMALLPAEGGRFAVLNLHTLIAADLATGDPLWRAGYPNQGYTWLSGALDAGGVTAVGRYGGALLVSRHAPDGTLLWSRQAPAESDLDLLNLGDAVRAGADLLVPYAYTDRTTQRFAGVLRISPSGEIRANWRPDVQFRTTGRGMFFSRPETENALLVARGQLFVTMTLTSALDGSTMPVQFAATASGERSGAPLYGTHVFPQADGGYLYLGNGITRGTSRGCAPLGVDEVAVQPQAGPRSFTMAPSASAPAVAGVAATAFSVALADVALDGLPNPEPASTCALTNG